MTKWVFDVYDADLIGVKENNGCLTRGIGENPREALLHAIENYPAGFKGLHRVLLTPLGTVTGRRNYASNRLTHMAGIGLFSVKNREILEEDEL